MNINSLIKKIISKLPMPRRIRISRTMIVTCGMFFLILLTFFVLGWDMFLFTQSFSFLKQKKIDALKQLSLTTQDINDAIHLLDERQEQFNAILQAATGTTTIVF